MKDIKLKASWIAEWNANLNCEQFREVINMMLAHKNGIISWTEDPVLIEYIKNFQPNNEAGE